MALPSLAALDLATVPARACAAGWRRLPLQPPPSAVSPAAVAHGLPSSAFLGGGRGAIAFCCGGTTAGPALPRGFRCTADGAAAAAAIADAAVAVPSAEYLLSDSAREALERGASLAYLDDDSDADADAKAEGGYLPGTPDGDVIHVSPDQDDGAEDELAIENLGISPEIVGALAARDITRLFPIQKAVLEPAMAGRDVIGRAKTGTGKTLAFGIPIMERITLQNAEDRTLRRAGRAPRCLVLAPTRELAKQVEREFVESAPHLACLCVYGGVSVTTQERTCKARGIPSPPLPSSRSPSEDAPCPRGVDVVVGTPGRVMDLINRGSLDLSSVQYLVLDEADQMLAVGFEEDVETILGSVPPERQTCLFSATMPAWVKKLTRKYLRDPLTIDLVGESDEKLAEGISLAAVRVTPQSKRSILADLITVHGKGGKAIVFTQTKKDADDVALGLSRTIGCEALHGDIAQHQREKTLQAFRDGRFTALVATDVASRGLDIPNVDLVVHYEVPNDPETFVHRSGRTGRAGKLGKAILLYEERQRRTLSQIERDVGCKFERVSPPHVDDVLLASSQTAADVISRVHPELTEVFLPAAEALLRERGPEALAAAIAHMSGFSQPPASKSLITHQEGLTTVRVVRTAASKAGPMASPRTVTAAVSDAHRGAADSIGKIRMISDRSVEGAVFDVPEKMAKELVRIKSHNGDEFDIPKELPRLVEEPGFERGRDSYGRFSSQFRGGPSPRGGGGGGNNFRSGGGYDSRERFSSRGSDRSDSYGGGGRSDRYGGSGGRSAPRRTTGGGSWDAADYDGGRSGGDRDRDYGLFSSGRSTGGGGDQPSLSLDRSPNIAKDAAWLAYDLCNFPLLQ
eukprot:SM000213S06810  [mRNA]  locus=s213:40998:47444:- [translate_table: standard]